MKTNNKNIATNCLAVIAAACLFLAGCASGPFGNSIFRMPQQQMTPPPVVINPDDTLETTDQVNAHESQLEGTAPDIMIDTSDLDGHN